ncbi:hypothetical protein Poli38472_009160 [Pythium oligandrum]|uniref:Midasin n=1 Tax=Pythium oligandrum TaxID=41045 RepID=A0A8K1FNU7_PYTOL|nr:hypothetical protein Poli38472_009160 [Pythium oligandrum]|eukprot:TMW64993.1 hypothetical protein Poli38472_009160 [Pythium oligandrum]
MAGKMTAFDAVSVATISMERFQRSVVEVLHVEPRIAQHPAVKAVLEASDWTQQVETKQTTATSIGEHANDDVTRAYLQALASCMVHEDFLWVILKHLRGFCMEFMARLMDPALVVYERKDSRTTPAEYTPCTNSIKRRERIAGALVTLLAFLPQTKHLVLQYFLESPCFFEYVSIASSEKEQTPGVRARLRRVVQVVYRLLHLYPQECTPMWNWSSMYPLAFHDDVRVRWYAARIVALVLRMSNQKRNAFLHELEIGEDAAVDGRHGVVRQIEIEEHRFDNSRQQQRVELIMDDDEYPFSEELMQENASRPVPFHESLTNVYGVIVPTNTHRRRQQDHNDNASTDKLVPTSSTKSNLQSLAIALGLKRPILVAGPGGCGKTAVLRELGRISGNDDMVELHLDDQIDSKTLLGSYVCTDIPGEFTWQPGALTTAVLEGRWVVIEDIERAPFEVLAALMPLLETREMVLPGRGELLVAHSNFQIFATTSHGQNMPKGFQESMWARVDVHPLGDNEIEEILLAMFGRIPPRLIKRVMTTFNVVCGKEQSEDMTSARLAVWKETRRNYGRDFSLRDLLKWCKRVYAFCYTGSGSNAADDDVVMADDQEAYITEEERLRIVVEACDVFCSGIRDVQTRLEAAIAIGAIWQVQEERIRYMIEQHKPSVNFHLHEVEIGRVHLPALPVSASEEGGSSSSSFVMTGHVLRLLEKLAAIVYTCEPALLVGETGCGKTTVIQHLAASMGQKLVVQNLNIQSDSSDLVGGFKPVELHLIARPLYMSFVDLFSNTFSQKSNAGFLNVVRVAFEHKDWKKMVKGMKKALQMAHSKFYGNERSADGGSNKMAATGASSSVLVGRWETFDSELSRFERQKEQVESHFAFAFVEGVLVKALREGHWVLLDEINLASSDTLERISTLLEHEKSAFSLTERGDVEIIRPHPNFRLFGAMNPSTDVGKKDLPPSLRNRFTEIYVDECVTPSDLQMVVQHQFREIASAPVIETVNFYLEARKEAEERLSDGARHKPRYSLRTLSQALHITRILIQRGYGLQRALYEGFSSTFCTLLDLDSRRFLERLIKNTFAKTLKTRDLSRAPPCPNRKAGTGEYILVSSYWVRQGGYMDPRDDSLPDPVTQRKKFVLTKSVEENLCHLARAALIGKYPVLLQGPTSAGKTSLISYLAARVGQKCVRINNHEHTDIQEYLGSYVSDSNGKLAFKEGVLVEAVRNGWWIILDELNLAPSEVLEALNRLLDDNRELFLPETQETVKPHPKFMLFATQNPPGLYGGRKVLSRAFRNRFLEIQVDEAPTSELQTILQERSSLPPSYCGILIDIMRQLQLVRQQSSIFAGKSGFITTRDLLRWAERRPATKQALAEEGYCLLAERLRKEDEKQIVKQVLEQKCNVKIDLDEMYYRGEARESSLLNENGEIEQETVWGSTEQFEHVQRKIEEALQNAGGDGSKIEGNAAGLDKISVTKALRRLFALVGRCLQHEEPVLLVGETGCGKTTVCQLYSLLFNQPLHIINCHQHTETSDFLGCLRPVRGKEKIAQDLFVALVEFLSTYGASEERMDWADLSLSDLLAAYERVSQVLKRQEVDGTLEEEVLGAMTNVAHLKRRYQSIFEWSDGPLVESMKKGDLILVDEVNLAEDAVLERLNSVLEPSRTLLLAEKGGDQVEEIVAHSKWRIMATMNPGGDFGKRELSPALRNRFTEIWVPAISDLDDIATIIRDRLVGSPSRLAGGPSTMQADLAKLCDPMLSFVKQFNEANGGIAGCGAVTLRDILSWINFICSVMKKQHEGSRVSAWTAFVQGAALSVLDGLGLGSDKALHTALKARDAAYQYLLELVPNDDVSAKAEVEQSLHATKQAIDDKIAGLNSEDHQLFGISPFMISRGSDAKREPSFSLKAPTTMSNLYRVLRAMQVNRPIILEGSPGVGKTSLISALAAASGHRLVRINLSEQTDISDLFGSDLPAGSSSDGNNESSGESKGMFEWCDGVFLRALKAGDWVLLDELNLASQSVLEGLNSCLDHRGTVYIPELDQEFECPTTFRVFAAQNPLRQGGGRKGLPKSFLNRFTRVFVETLLEDDLIHIASSIYPTLNEPMPGHAVGGQEKSVLERMIAFNTAIHKDTMEDCKYGRLGAPWEFNLRDVFRFCELLQQHDALFSAKPEALLEALQYYVHIIYLERMRSQHDREFVARRFEQFFKVKPSNLDNVSLRIEDSFVQIGRAFLPRQDQLRLGRVVPPVFNFLLKPMEALVHCVNLNWPALLVGAPGSGKTSAVRLLAALSGNTLHELGMSAGTDATELLGCFEQVDLGRKLRDLREQISDTYETLLQAMVQKASEDETSASTTRVAWIKQARHVSNLWWTLASHEQESSENKSNDANGSSATKKKQLTKGQLDNVVVDLMIDILSALMKSCGMLGAAMNNRLVALEELKASVEAVVRLSASSSIASSFEWVDGTLLQAMERGEWILLDNVNFCSSSVLDRLNSLMETGGELLVNECGVINGKLRVIKPHRNFRLFLAMDPQFGEVSRAMRNRCVEITLLECDEQPRDLVVIAGAAGIPGFEMSRAFMHVHRTIINKVREHPAGARAARLNRRHLENWAQLAMREMQRDLPVLLAVKRAFVSVYGEDTLVQLGCDEDLVEASFTRALEKERGSSPVTVPSSFDICHRTELVMLKRDFVYIDYLLHGSTQSDDATTIDVIDDLLVGCFGADAQKKNDNLESASELDLVSFVERLCSTELGEMRATEVILKTAQKHLTSVEFFPFGGSTIPVLLAPFALRRLIQVLSSTTSRIITEERLLFLMETMMKEFTTGDAGPCNASAYLLFRFLRSLLTSQMYVNVAKEMRATVAKLLSQLGHSAPAVGYPVYLVANVAAFTHLETLVAKRVAEDSMQAEQLQALWNEILSVQTRLELMDGTEWLRFCEEEQYQQIDSLLSSSSSGERSPKRQKTRAFDGDLSGFSILQQSYAVHQYHADRSTIANDLVFLVFPLLESFDTWMTSAMNQLPREDEVAQAVKRLLRDRYEFSMQMRDRAFDWTHFLIHWHVVDMRQRIDDAIAKIVGSGSDKSVLWKHGGHALLPRSAGLWNARYLLERLTKTHMQLGMGALLPMNSTEQHQQVDVLALLFGGVVSMEAAMKSGQLDVSALFYVDATSRREILHALCAFSYISKQQQRQAIAQNAGEKAVESQIQMAEEILKLPEVLLARLEAQRTKVTTLISKKTLYLSELEDTSANQHLIDFIQNEDDIAGRVGRDAPILLFDMKESAVLMEQLVDFQLTPLKEHALARQEVQVISELVRIVNLVQLSPSASVMDVRDLVHKIRDVLARVEAVIDVLIALGSRSPATFYAYQDIVWCGHRFMSSDESLSQVASETFKTELIEFVDVIKSHLHSVLYGFHQFLRQNAFNDSESIAMEIFDTQNKMRKHIRNKKHGYGRADAENEAAEHRVVVHGLPRVFQAASSAVLLRSIAEVNLLESNCATIETQVREVRMSKIKAHLQQRESMESAQVVVDSTNTLLVQLFVSTVSAFASTFARWMDAQDLLGRLVLAQDGSFSDHDKTALLRVLRTSSDASFVALVDELVSPLVSIFVQSKDTTSNLLLGEGFVLLGLWRFLLLLPSSPVDPVIKPLVKKEMLMNRVAMLAFQSTVDGAIHRLSPLPASTRTQAVRNESDKLGEQVRHVSAFAIQRYDPSRAKEHAVAPSVFGEMFRDLQRFQKTIMLSEKLLAFVSIVRSGLNSESKCRQIFRELEMFQQTTESFIVQLANKYSTSFYDIVEPVAAAVLAVKEGIAMLTWHIHQKLQERSVPIEDKTNLALTLLRFPRSPAHEGVSSSEEGIFRLVRMLGSNTLPKISAGKKTKEEVALLHVALTKMALSFRETLANARTMTSSSQVSAQTTASILDNSRAIFDLFLTKWQDQKAREEARRLEEEQLFKYKTRTVDIASEDELLEEEYRQQFPNYTNQDFQVFLTPEQQAAAGPQTANSSLEAGALWISDKLMQELCEMHIQLYAASPASAASSSNKSIVDAFARAFALAVNMRQTINTLNSDDVEHAMLSSGLFAASLVQSRLRVGQVPTMSALNAEYLRGIDFHRDPFVKEVVLVVQPLQNLLLKAQAFLALWPEHAILQQIVLIADRIRNFEISSPLVRTLTAIELLVRKAQEWEAYASREYSIATELGALSSLITRWRKLELYSWPHLLYVKERQHRLAAEKTWFNMYSLLTAQFEGDAEGVSEEYSLIASKKEWQWLQLNEFTQWVFAASSKTNTDVAQTQQQWRNDLFSTLDAYVRSCAMGQYENRLVMVYAFGCQLFLEFWQSGDQASSKAQSAKYGLANVLYHLYRYYGQHLHYLERQWSGLKAPIQRQLLEFVKISRWDEQTYYSLAESAEKSHRKLMKFVRDYDAVLTVPMQTVIDASTDNGISKESGYVGIGATKAELERVNDGVFVPELPTYAKKHSENDGDEEGAEVKKEVAPPADIEEEPESVVVVLTHTPSQLPATANVVSTLSTPSSYAEKLPHLAKRIAKYTSQQILSLESVKQRQVPREICEELCSTIFYRMAILQKDDKVKEGPKLPKGAKKKALIDLLGELRTQGLAYHRMQLPQEQQQIEQLFALDVPNIENCIQLDGLNDLVVVAEDASAVNAKKSKQKKNSKNKREKKLPQAQTEDASGEPAKDSPQWLWQRADAYYYRFISQLSSLRFSSMTQFSHDLSSSEVDRMNGYAENMLFRMLQQRQLLHASALSHEKLLLALHRMRQLQQWRKDYVEAQDEPTVSVSTAIQWQQHQIGAVKQLREPLRELEVIVTQVLRTSSNATSTLTPIAVKQQFEELFTLLDSVASSFELRDSDSGRVLRKSFGVPTIPFHASISSDEDEHEGRNGLVGFAHPSKRVHGFSPAVTQAASDGESSSDAMVPVGAATLQANRTHLQKVREAVVAIQTSFGAVAPTTSFDEIVAALDRITQRENTFASTPATQEMETDASQVSTVISETFVQQYDQLIASILVAIQDLTKKPSSESGDKKEEDDAVTLREQLSTLTSTVKNARIHPIATQLTALIDLVNKQYGAFLETSCSSTAHRDALLQSLRLLELLEPTVVDLRAISRQLLVDLLVAHKSVTKLDFILVRIFRNLYQHGFCRSSEEQSGDKGDGSGQNMKFEDDVEGTGMGEGEGKKDVSNEIEDEEQLLGLKGEENEQKPPEEGEKPDDTGMEMQNDFEGTMQDVPDDDQDQNDEDNDDEEELDREMGEFDQDDENVVDEKKWGEDSDDDEDKIDKENEKFEDNSRMDGSEAIEDEIRGKDDEEDSKKSKDDALKEDKETPKDQPKDDKEDGGGSDDEDMDEDGEEDKKDPVNDDLEDKYEEKHDQVDPNSRDGEQDDEHGGDEGDELPENMQLDDGEDGDEEDGAGEDMPDDMDDVDADDETEDPNGDETMGEQEEQGEDEQDQNEEEPLDNAVQLGAGGLDDEENAPEEEDAEPDKEEMQNEDESSEQQKSNSAVAGTQSKDGTDELEQDATQGQEEDQTARDDAEMEEQNENQQTSKSMSQSTSAQDEKQEWRPSSEVEKREEKEEQKRNRRREEPNPYRNPQNAQEHWKKRVEMIKRDDEEKNDDAQGDKNSGDDQEMATAELLDDDEEMEDAQYALAPAQENQVMNQQNADQDDEKEQNEKDQADGNGATAMEVEDDDEQADAKDQESKDEDQNESEVKEEKVAKQERDHEADKDKIFDKKSEQDEQKPEAKPKEEAQADYDIDMDEVTNNTASLMIQQPGDGKRKDRLADEDEEDDEERPMPKLLSPEEVASLREELDTSISTWSRSEQAARGAELWSKYTAITMGASQRLCEQLRLVLEPMLRAKLEGDFRTGKRINMRKVIPYIASQFRKDKIWMRRTRPSKRQYQIMVGIDDSESMADNHAGRLALEAMTTLCKALTQLEVGEISVVKFGEDIQLLHAFDSPFTDDAGSRVITQFGFQQKKTNMIMTLDAILQVLETAKQNASSASNSTVEFTQIVFLISDGRFDTDGRTRIKKLIEKALEQQQLIVLLVVDHVDQQANSILETKSVTFNKGKVEMVPYLENYPFPYYVLLPTSTLLPEILSDSLRQWFEMLQMKH